MQALKAYAGGDVSWVCRELSSTFVREFEESY
jgi:hypothetical protein